ncbi:hypothetical protein HNY73_014006 [Argiope bruennichi]|uniref:Pre-C2HC domain-containing protein n=1 Tax=Argiope bruennichi TaxID=94029 RepID=A0A8T0EMG9_ARGBR|nr:hypothetical protein HNY73_014006 [Argiope bruennichi]
MIIDRQENDPNIPDAPACQTCAQRNFTEIAIYGIQMEVDGLNKALKNWIKNPNLPQDHPTLLDIDAKRADAISRLEEAHGNLSHFVCQDAKCNLTPNPPTFLKAQENEKFQSPTKRKTARNNPSQNSNPEITTRNRFSPIESIKERETKATSTKVSPIMLRYADKFQTILADIQKVCGPTDNKFKNGFIKIFPNSIEQHQKIQSYATSQGYDYYIIKPKNKRPVKVIIKGLPIDHEAADIFAYIKTELGFCVIKVVQLTQTRTSGHCRFF